MVIIIIRSITSLITITTFIITIKNIPINIVILIIFITVAIT